MEMQEFLAKHPIRFVATHADRNPYMADDAWASGATHWRCKLSVGRKRMTVYFSQGSAHTSAPTAADVLGCLASDAASIAMHTFEEWTSEMGWDSDSIRAHRTYQNIRAQATRLRALLGDDVYGTLLYSVDAA